MTAQARPSPDYCKRETLARRLDLAPGAIDQLVKRGLLPPPIAVGEAKLWRWEDVDSWLQRGHTPEVTHDDPYLSGLDRANAAKTSAARENGAQPHRPPVLLPPSAARHGQGGQADPAAG